MSDLIHGICWIPNTADNFATWGTEINLYKIISSEEKDTSEGYGKDIPPKSSAIFLASESRYQYIRCVKPSYVREALVAVGLANGAVSLCNFNQSNGVTCEFIPRQQRTCLCLAWNEVDKNILAIGHDRNRSDYCITVWDTGKGGSKESCSLFGLSESGHSLCWDKDYKMLMTGMSQKYIKVFDLRQGSMNCSTVATRLVHGLCISSDNRYLASYADSIVGLWDIRNLEKPVITLQNSKNITSLAWCPSRAAMLSTVQRDSPFLQLINTHCADIDGSTELFCTKRLLLPLQTRGYPSYKNSTIIDMSWHSLDLERVLVLSDKGAINDFEIPETTAVAWDTKNNLWKSIGQNMHYTSNIQDSKEAWECTSNDVFKEEMSQIMYKRTLNDYGLMPDTKKNGDLSQSSNLKDVWNVLSNMIRDEKLISIREVLGAYVNTDGNQIIRSETLVMPWPESINSSQSLLCYKSEARDFAQSLSGWTFENDMEILQNKFIPDLCIRKEFSRAAMICTFHLKIKQAIDILLRAADQCTDPSILRMAAIALSGFNSDRCNFILRNQRGHLQIHDPHLRALFGFLTTENELFDTVVMEKGISLGDRVAFACKYLSDNKLMDFVKISIQSCIDSADLNGLLLTGETNDGINLLQSYLDWTDDVQTASLIAIRFFHHELLSEYRIQYWISSYLDLLDTWGLWEKRAELEIKMETMRAPSKTMQTVFLLCNFCGKSVSATLQEDTRLRNASSNLNKLSSCPNCRKPLPRCSLCLLHMGTTTSNFQQVPPGNECMGWQSKPFSKWFSWCQTCRHGGHTEHLIQWFKQNMDCPVTACSCKCFTMDLAVAMVSRDT